MSEDYWFRQRYDAMYFSIHGEMESVNEQDAHQCHFCGEWVLDGVSTETGKRHHLSDCRPDLVKHEIGPSCTWHDCETMIEGELKPIYPDCYAYQDRETRKWTDEHTHFYKDGPM